MTSFVIIGRVGARITAELGTMAVSEQIDALYSLGRDPVSFLAAPRLIAGMITTPLLVGIADAVGVFSGLVAAQAAVGLGPDAFLYGARLFWHSWDLFYSLMKAGSSASSSRSSPCTWASSPTAEPKASAATPRPRSSS
jgi:phospholipid/cholesterol/gamma-HCH transport system permease protein